MLLRPIITQSLPAVSMLYFLSISITPAGVQGRKSGLPVISLPTLFGWKASTSFCSLMAFIIFCSFMWGGRGSCTSIPCTVGSLLSTSIRSKSCCSDAVLSRIYSRDFIPQYSQARFLFLTYTLDAGSSPTSTTARQGTPPSFLRAATCSFTSSLTAAETAFPSIIFIGFFPPWIVRCFQRRFYLFDCLNRLRQMNRLFYLRRLSCLCRLNRLCQRRLLYR